MCFPTSQGDAVIVFNRLYIEIWGVICLEFYIVLHVMIIVIFLLPIECLS